MVQVRINGEESPVKASDLPLLADLVELIKGVIDPDHMITSLLIDGREFEEGDWSAMLSKFETSIIEVQTDTPAKFLDSRMRQAANVVRDCYLRFRDARKCFQSGSHQEGSQLLGAAANTTQAFVEWYCTLLEIASEEEKQRYNIVPQIEKIMEICQRITQQQLYNSWWAIGETIKGELEPALDELEDFLRGVTAQT